MCYESVTCVRNFKSMFCYCLLSYYFAFSELDLHFYTSLAFLTGHTDLLVIITKNKWLFVFFYCVVTSRWHFYCICFVYIGLQSCIWVWLFSQNEQCPPVAARKALFVNQKWDFFVFLAFPVFALLILISAMTWVTRGNTPIQQIQI